MSTSPGARQAPAAVDHQRVLGRAVGEQPGTEIGDPLVFDQEAARRIEPARRIEQTGADDRGPPGHAAARSSRVRTSRQAMRTATPSST